MNFKESIITCLKHKYATFSGRARRSEYWFFALFTTIVESIVSIIFSDGDGVNFLGSLINLAVFVPSLAVSVRRLHDIGKSGWYLLIMLIPIAGPIILIIKLAQDSMPGANAYGPCPKTFGTASAAGAYSAPSYSAPSYTAPAAEKPSEPETPVYTEPETVSNPVPEAPEPPKDVDEDYEKYTTTVNVEGTDVTLEAEHTVIPPSPEAEINLNMNKRCPDCGAVMPSDAKFCSICGGKLI